MCVVTLRSGLFGIIASSAPGTLVIIRVNLDDLMRLAGYKMQNTNAHGFCALTTS